MSTSWCKNDPAWLRSWRFNMSWLSLMDMYIQKYFWHVNDLTKGMLMLNSIWRAFILQAVHAGSLYLNTTISVINYPGNSTLTSLVEMKRIKRSVIFRDQKIVGLENRFFFCLGLNKVSDLSFSFDFVSFLFWTQWSSFGKKRKVC